MFYSIGSILLFSILSASILLTNGEYSSDKPCFIQPLVTVGNKQVYFGTNFKGNFFEASDFCRRHCMQLVSIESETEQKDIVHHIRANGYGNEDFWTSGNDLGQEGIFTWASTGNRLTYTNWLSGEPNNVVRDHIGENCLHIWSHNNYQWNDLQCHDKFFFICEIRL